MDPEDSIHQHNIQNTKALKNHKNDIIFQNNYCRYVQSSTYIYKIFRDCKNIRIYCNYKLHVCCPQFDHGAELSQMTRKVRNKYLGGYYSGVS